MSTFEISVLVVILVAAAGAWAYLHSMRKKLLPAVPTLNVGAPVTVAHLQPILNELRDLKGQMQGNSVVATVAKRVEDLHTRWDKDDEKQRHDEKPEEKKA